MGIPVLLLLIGVAAALPDLLPDFLSIRSHPPDLWVALTAYLALRARGFESLKWAIFLGLVKDALSLDPLGTHGFVLGAVAWLFAEGGGRRGAVDGLSRLILTAAAALLAGWIYLLRLLPMGGGVVTAGAFLDALPAALWTTVLSASVFPLLDRWRLLDDLCGRKRGLPA
jgi:rod shape-determining protein MreD